MKTTLLALAASLTLALPAVAHEFTLGALTIDHPMAFETSPTAMSGGGYLSITNTGDTPDRLIAVRADYPHVSLHTTEMMDGVAKMMEVDGVEIAPGETVKLQPGGLHVMFMGLKGKPFVNGGKIPAVLVFEKAGEIDVTFNVESRGADGMDHGKMDHDKPAAE